MKQKLFAQVLLILSIFLILLGIVMIFLGAYGILNKDIKGYYQFLSFALLASGFVMGYIGIKHFVRHRKIFF
jgi:hypothetical protein